MTAIGRGDSDWESTCSLALSEAGADSSLSSLAAAGSVARRPAGVRRRTRRPASLASFSLLGDSYHGGACSRAWAGKGCARMAGHAEISDRRNLLREPGTCQLLG